MKKLSVWALLLAMCVTMLAGCSNNNETPATTPDTTPESVVEKVEEESGLEDAVAYVKTIYKKEEGKITAKDYTLVGSVPVGAKTFEITWTTNVSEDLVSVVRGEDGMVTIDVNEEAPEEVVYVLTASLTDGTKTESLSWNHILPAGKKGTLAYSEIVALAYGFADGEKGEDTYRLFGTITNIDTAYNPDYQNVTVTIVVAGCEEQPIMCYRLKGEGAENLAVGDAITVEGTFTNYKGTIEFNSGCVLVGYGEIVDQKALLEAAYALADGDAFDELSVLTGVVSEIPTAWSDEYGNITVNLDFDGKVFQCYRLTGEGAKDIQVGDTITVVGTIKNYKGLIEFDKGCKLIATDAHSSVKNILAAYKVQDGEKLEFPMTVTGTITTIDTAWSDDYGNITVTIAVPGFEEYPIMCYRLSGEGAKDLAVGDVITVTGQFTNYKGTIEFAQGCKLN